MKTQIEKARERAEEAGGYLIRRQGAKYLVRWPDGLGGQVSLETLDSLSQAANLTEASPYEEERK